jgi:hypothetical protein
VKPTPSRKWKNVLRVPLVYGNSVAMMVCEDIF